MSKKLEELIKKLVSEEIGVLRGNYHWGKDRNGGDVNPPEYAEWGSETSREVEYEHKLRDLEPVIKRSHVFDDFMEQVGQVNPNDQASLFALYRNFLRYFGISREQFQDGKGDDWSAANAVAEYFKYHPSRIGNGLQESIVVSNADVGLNLDEKDKLSEQVYRWFEKNMNEIKEDNRLQQIIHLASQSAIKDPWHVFEEQMRNKFGTLLFAFKGFREAYKKDEQGALKGLWKALRLYNELYERDKVNYL